MNYCSPPPPSVVLSVVTLSVVASPLELLLGPSFMGRVGHPNLAFSAVGALNIHVTIPILDDPLSMHFGHVLVKMVRPAEAAFFAAIRQAGAAAPAFRTVDADASLMRCLQVTAEIKRTREGRFASGVEADVGFGLGDSA